jgi:hypothetical protein
LTGQCRCVCTCRPVISKPRYVTHIDCRPYATHWRCVTTCRPEVTYTTCYPVVTYEVCCGPSVRPRGVFAGHTSWRWTCYR